MDSCNKTRRINLNLVFMSGVLCIESEFKVTESEIKGLECDRGEETMRIRPDTEFRNSNFKEASEIRNCKNAAQSISELLPLWTRE